MSASEFQTVLERGVCAASAFEPAASENISSGSDVWMRKRRKRRAPMLAVLTACIVLPFTLFGFMPAPAAEKTKVLIITGGHGFEKEPFFKMFEDNPDITFTAAAHSKTNADAYDRDDLLRYDVVVLYDMPKEITEAQKAKFLSLFDMGIGLVVLHHALVSYPNWPEYEKIIGGRYPEPVPSKPGTVTEQAGYQHHVEIPVVIVATNHPITAGLENFTITDEIYWGFRVRPDVTPLITTTHPKSGKPLAWTRTEGKSRVVFIQLGHGPSAFNNENYRKLLAQSIRWTTRRNNAGGVRSAPSRASEGDAGALKLAANGLDERRCPRRGGRSDSVNVLVKLQREKLQIAN